MARRGARLAGGAARGGAQGADGVARATAQLSGHCPVFRAVGAIDERARRGLRPNIRETEPGSRRRGWRCGPGSARDAEGTVAKPVHRVSEQARTRVVAAALISVFPAQSAVHVPARASASRLRLPRVVRPDEGPGRRGKREPAPVQRVTERASRGEEGRGTALERREGAEQITEARRSGLGSAGSAGWRRPDRVERAVRAGGCSRKSSVRRHEGRPRVSVAGNGSRASA